MSKILDMLAALATVGMFFITFLIRMKFDLGYRDARGLCAMRSDGNVVKDRAAVAPTTLNPKSASPA